MRRPVSDNNHLTKKRIPRQFLSEPRPCDRVRAVEVMDKDLAQSRDSGGSDSDMSNVATMP